jgi:hypothetical protein
MLYFVLGIITGIVFAAWRFSNLIIGKLKRVQDEEGVYPYMVLNDPNIDNIFKKKYVILKTSDSHE